MTAETAVPVSFEAFATSMAALAAHRQPFSDQPHVAVAVSGGSDSLALVLLADAWCRVRGGRVSALTVDHGLRAEAAAEAAQVAAWLLARGIDHHVLSWQGAKPEHGVQAKARDARYRLMDDWCGRAGVDHLLVGHTADDQAETVLMRLKRCSGPDGLAGMSAVRRLAHCSVLRPLLRIRRGALQGFLAGQGQAWMSDPSNTDRRYARTRARADLQAGRFDVDALCAAARRYGQMRVVAELAADRFMAAHMTIAPAGYMTGDAEALTIAPDDTALRVLSSALTSVGGGWYPPKRRAVEDLLAALRDAGGAARTLGGCRVARNGTGLMICREARNLPAARLLAPNMDFRWDGRIRVRTDDALGAGWRLVAADRESWAEGRRNGAAYRAWRALPAPVRSAVPVLADASGVFSAPLLAYNQRVPGTSGELGNANVTMTFAPRRGTALAGFCVA